MNEIEEEDTGDESDILVLDDVYSRADWFSKECADYAYEMGDAQNFIRALCDVFKINPYRAVRFEDRIPKGALEGFENQGGINRIDALFPGALLVEMKSKGKNLDAAYEQACRYIPKLKKASDTPRYVLVSDFQNLHLYDLGEDKSHTDSAPLKIKLADFRQHVESFSFLLGYERQVQLAQEEANIRAAEKLGALHDAIKETGYEGEHLQKLLVRILFCLFADDTDLFGENDQFLKLIEQSSADGSNVNCYLAHLFFVLDKEIKPAKFPKQYQNFPYINGSLFKGDLPHFFFTSDARTALLECAKIDWSEISPDIFGSLFQFIMHFNDESNQETHGKTQKRREFGAHYTSEENILKVIHDLFLEDFKDELRTAKKDKKKLNLFLAKLESAQFLDPACGCGNFLVVAYREIRLLEEEALRCLFELTNQARLPACNVTQFYGIEIDPTATEIATLALWLTDHQMNRRVKNSTGGSYTRLPLKDKAPIVCENALRMDWHDLMPAKDNSFVMGNPPFVGAKFLTDRQREDTQIVFHDMKSSGLLDYVAGWYVKAASYLIKAPTTPVAFVSTNSITQGEQVSMLWPYLLKKGIQIRFAHRTFQWTNKGKGLAAVHCVIVGFCVKKKNKKWARLYSYETPQSHATRKVTKRINPYLVNAPDVIIEKRSDHFQSDVPEITKGSQPSDGGYLLLSQSEADDVYKTDAIASKYIKAFVGADEFINNIPRYCFWLLNASAEDCSNSPELKRRIAAVKVVREKSKYATSIGSHLRPAEFERNRQPNTNYLLVPSVSSERRAYVPIGFMAPDTIASNLVLTIPNATLYHFGILTSTLHMAWMRGVCGRLESRYRYSAGIVYNNFPWPDTTELQKASIGEKAEGILDIRKNHPDKSLAFLYNADTMPDNLKAAHLELDKAVDAAYHYKKGVPDIDNPSNTDPDRLAFLFECYEKQHYLMSK